MKTVLLVFSLPLLLIWALTACTNNSEIVNTKKRDTQYKNQSSLKKIPTVQTDRYTIVELDDINKYVLHQIIDISLPKNINLTVKDGMNYVLQQSGYTLCDNADIDILYDSVLPKFQYKMGPISLNKALEIIAGPAFKLTIDDIDREVCFELKKGYHRKSKLLLSHSSEKTELTQKLTSTDVQDQPYQTAPRNITEKHTLNSEKKQQ